MRPASLFLLLILSTGDAVQLIISAGLIVAVVACLISAAIIAALIVRDTTRRDD